MKKFIVKFTAFAIILGLIFIPVNVLVDPYNIFHYSAPRDNGVEANKNFIKTKYVLENKDKFDSYLFGSSRAGFMDVSYLSEKTGENWYCMASSEAVVRENVDTLKVFIKNGEVPKSVMVLIDDIDCFVDPESHKSMLYRVPYPTGGVISFLEFYVKYFDLFTTYDSIKVINEHTEVDETAVTRFQTTGTESLIKPSTFDPSLPQFQVGYHADYYKLRNEEALEDIRNLKALCEENGITLYLVTNPLYYSTYEWDLENGYYDYIKGVSEITDFYNFSCFSDVTLNYKNYYETSHFTPEVGRMMIDRVTDTPSKDLTEQCFGVYVDENSRQAFLDKLKWQAENRGVKIYE